jgi:hypothetical protein
MIDTDDLDRTLRAAFNHASERDLVAADPAPRVARHVTRRRHRRLAARVATVVVVVGVAAAMIGGLFSASKSKPAHFGPPPTAPSPSALLRPQTAADRAGIRLNGGFDSSAVPSTIRLLATNDGVRLFGARDRTGMLCVLLDDAAQGDTSSSCSASSRSNGQLQLGAERFEQQGTGEGISGRGRWIVAHFLPDGITTVVIDRRHVPVVGNAVLLVSKQPLEFGTTERRVGSTLYLSK